MVRCWSIVDPRPEALRHRSRGQALVEFAIIIPVFLLLLFGLLDFGRVIYAQQTITQDAREGARAGEVAALDTTVDNTSYAKIRTAALAMAPGVALTSANITGLAGACPSPLPADSVSGATCFFPDGVTCTDATNPPRVVVKIRIAVPLLTPILSNLVGGTITPTAQSITYLPC
jgi:Flp pilus assembly protein TadG